MAGGVYNVGVHLSAVNGISGVLAVIGKEVLGLNGGVKELEHGFKGLNKGLIGGAMLAASAGLAEVAMHFEKAGEQLVHAETVLSAGLPQVSRAMDMQIARTAAYAEAGNNLNTTLTGNVEALHDLYNVVLDMGEASKLLPVFNNLKNAFAFAKGSGAETGDHDDKDIASAARAFELAGRTTEGPLAKISQEYVKAVIGMRGRVDGSALLGVMQTAGASRYGWSDDFITKALPSLINVMGARAGTGLYALGNNLFGGVSSSLAQGLGQEKWGLHTPEQEVRDPITKRFLGYKVGSVRNAKMLNDNPLNWANDYRNYLKNDRGVNVDNTDTMRGIAAEIGRGNKQLQAVMDELLLPQPNAQMNKHVSKISGVGDDALGIGRSDDPDMVWSAFHKQIDNMDEAIGKVEVAPLLDEVKQLTQVFSDITQWSVAPENAATLRGYAEGIAGLGVALAGGGAVAIMAALGPAGWIAAGIIGLGVAIETHKNQLQNYYDNPGNGLGSGIGARQKWWDEEFAKLGANTEKTWNGILFGLKDIVSSTETAFSRIPPAVETGIGKIATMFETAISALPGEVSGAVSSAFAAIGAKISSAVQAIPGEIGGFVGNLFHHSSYSPGAPAPRAPVLHANIQASLDGEVVHRSVVRRELAAAEHSHQAPAYDSAGYFTGPDGQIWDAT